MEFDSLATAIRKVSGGKLVRIDLQVEDEQICSVKLTGDFFLHPEGTVDIIEKTINHLAIPIDKIHLKEKLTHATKGATFVGFSIDDVLDLVEEACARVDESKASLR